MFLRGLSRIKVQPKFSNTRYGLQNFFTELKYAQIESPYRLHKKIGQK